MGAEVAAFLVMEKLQSIFAGGELIVVPGLRSKLKETINRLQQLSDYLALTYNQVDGSSDPNPDIGQRSSIEVTKVLAAIDEAEAVVNTYLGRRNGARRKGAAISLIQLNPLGSQMDLAKGIKKLMNDVQLVSCGPNSGGPKNGSSDSRVIEESSKAPPRTQRWQNICHSSSSTNFLDMERLIVSELTTIKQISPEDEEDRKAMRIVSVVGAAGSGKTRLVRSVYNRAEVKKDFDVRAWVCLSGDLVIKDVVVDLIRQATMSRSGELDQIETDALRRKLYNLLSTKRYLVVLDDMTNSSSISWDNLAAVFPDFLNGSRVAVTTPDAQVAEDLLSDLTVDLKALNLEETWKLLTLEQQQQQVGDDIRATTQTSSFQEKVMNKCGSNTTAVCLLAGILQNQQVSRWGAVIDRVPPWDQDRGKIPFNMLRFSFQELVPVLKVCLVHMSLFPKAFEIPVRRLLFLWLAEGFFFNSNHHNDSPEDAADIYFENLVNRNLIEVTRWSLDGTPTTCRMSSLVYDFLKQDSVRTGLFREYPDDESSHHRCHCGSSHRLTEYSSNNQTTAAAAAAEVELVVVAASASNNDGGSNFSKHLHSFISFNTKVRGIPNTKVATFFDNSLSRTRKKGFPLLRVLDLEGMYKPVLPDIMGNFLLLRFLGLRSTVLDSVPSWIGDLPLLETLDLKHTNVTALPKSIWKSKTLRHLYVSEVRLGGSIQKPLARGSLSNLQTFSGFHVVHAKVVSNVLQRMVNLRKVRLTCQINAVTAVAKWILKLLHLQSLKLRSIDLYGKPSDLTMDHPMEHQKLCTLYLLGHLTKSLHLHSLLPKCIRKLTLSMSNLNDDPMPVLGDCPQLVILRLFADSYKGNSMICSTGKFPKLRSLKLWRLEQLQDWTIEQGAMPCLEELELRSCGNMTHLITGLQHLHCLTDFVLTCMPVDFVNKTSERSDYIHFKKNDWDFTYTNTLEAK